MVAWLPSLVAVLVSGAPRPAPPTIDVAVRQVCDTRLEPGGLCTYLDRCGPFEEGRCAADNRAEQQGAGAWSSWRCEADVRNGFLTCSEEYTETEGPGAGDVSTFTYDAALFVAKSSVLVGISRRGDRPRSWFFEQTGAGWRAASPLPALPPDAFGLGTTPTRKKFGSAQEGLRPEFFVELTLPRVGTTVSAEGRWVNTYRDDSGYGQPPESVLSSASRQLAWNRTTGRFLLQR